MDQYLIRDRSAVNLPARRRAALKPAAGRNEGDFGQAMAATGKGPIAETAPKGRRATRFRAEQGPGEPLPLPSPAFFLPWPRLRPAAGTASGLRRR